VKIHTQVVHPSASGDPFAAVAVPLYQTATFTQASATEFGRFDYSRSGNPTRAVLEDLMARLDGASRSFAFSSGMAALTAVTRLLRPGDHVLAGADIYGGTFRLLDACLSRCGVDVECVDASDVASVRRALRPATALLLVESPGNPLQRVVDLPALAEITAAAGICFAVDNSLMSPYLQLPLRHGADLVIHSATKHLGGHSDLIAGVVSTRDAELAERLAFVQNAEGAALAPFDCWLLLRGIQTLAVRVEHQQRGAAAIAAFLEAHPAVTRLHYVGRRDHPGAAVHRRQAAGPGTVLSFETGSLSRSRGVVEATRLFHTAVSFGGAASAISLPCCMSHAAIPAAVREQRALPPDLVRVSVGLEAADDLIDDLAAAFESTSGDA